MIDRVPSKIMSDEKESGKFHALGTYKTQSYQLEIDSNVSLNETSAVCG